MGRILVVDDDRPHLFIFRELLEELGHESVETHTGEEGLQLIEREAFDAVLLDVMMPGLSGMEVLKKIRESHSQLPVIMVTALDVAESAMEAMTMGAYDYLTKPVRKDVLGGVLERAVEAGQRMRVRVEFGEEERAEYQPERIVGRSPAMWELYKSIGQVAATDAAVLITGESGTGKELVARAIYQHSSRRDKVFLKVDCAALPESLLESELFGQEKGAYSGALRQHLGKFERAEGGSVFLDEVGEISLVTQTKLLRVLQDKCFERVGGNDPIDCNVRIIAATNKDLHEEVEDGRFRKDLFLRLNVIHLRIPPLRDRKEDISELCDYLLKQISRDIGKAPPLISAEAMQLLLDHHWPGNVRELRNALLRATVSSRTSIILPEHVVFDDARYLFDSSGGEALMDSEDRGAAAPAQAAGEDTDIPEDIYDQPLSRLMLSDLDKLDEGLYRVALANVEAELVRYALKRTGNTRTEAAKLLGISRNKLYDLLKRYDLQSSKASGDGNGAKADEKASSDA